MERGRPRKFKTVEELQSKIDSYFESCWGEDQNGEMIQKKPYTISGLALHLDTTRDTLLHYERDNPDFSDFFDTIKKAKQKCETYVEEYLFTGKNTAGAIFNLKNNYKGWKDQQDIEMNLKKDELSDEELQSIVAQSATSSSRTSTEEEGGEV